MAHQEPLQVTMHLLTNPGDSLLLQHTLDRLLKWVCPGLRLFHVSERACPLREGTRGPPCPASVHPALAVTLFLHEAYGEERILRVLDFFQCPPWQYHHSEGRAGDAHAGPPDALARPYLLPGRDFYGLGVGMPLWAVRPVHCGGESVRVTLHSSCHNFEDAVRLYETILRRRAEEQKAGFCWFTVFADRGVSVQMALKQLPPGVRAEPCHSAVLQFRVGEIGQLVPLLPNPCSPISATRWQTEDLDGNKILFQVKGGGQPQRLLASAFPLNCPSLPLNCPGLPLNCPGLPPRTLLRCPVPTHVQPASPAGRLAQLKERALGKPRVDLPQDGVCGPRVGGCGGGSVGSGSACSTPPASSCYSSQRSSPATLSINPLEPTAAADSSEPRLLLGREEEPEMDVDTGRAVGPQARWSAPALETLARDLRRFLPEPQRTWGRGEGVLTETSPPHPTAQRPTPLHASTQPPESLDEFFI
ncbi:protein FAM124B isoform X2 [Brachyhypopomus gauderio]